MQRRNFLKNTTLMAVLPFVPLAQFKFLNQPFFMGGDIVKINIGKIKCTIIRDFMFKYMAKDFFINANDEELNQALNKYHITGGSIASPFIALLLEHDNKKILIDTGIGFLEKPLIFRGNSYLFEGRLEQLLQQENIKKEEITDVIITHFHPDHNGGIFSESRKLNFPNAQFHMHEDEWSYWHSSQADSQPDLFKYFVEKNISPLKNLNLSLVKGDFVEIMPGVTAVKADGHTPGQMTLIIHSEKEHFLYISDSFLHPLHIEKLDWQTNYDLDPVKAKQSRIKLLDIAHKDNMLVNAFHFDFPGLGRIDKLKNNWAWKYSEK